MKRIFLSVVALLFVCTFALAIIGARAYEKRSSVPTFVQKRIEREFTPPKLKKMKPHFAP